MIRYFNIIPSYLKIFIIKRRYQNWKKFQLRKLHKNYEKKSRRWEETLYWNYGQKYYLHSSDRLRGFDISEVLDQDSLQQHLLYI